jgi:type II secretory pathway component GspD/PulD (secretin)
MISAKVFLRTALISLLLFLLVAPAGRGAGPQKVIHSLNLQNADLLAVLRFLSEFGGQNIVASASVKGTVVDVQLRNVTWREALEIIMKINHLAAMEEEGYIRVLPLDELYSTELELQQYLQDRENLAQLEHRIIPVEHAKAEEIQKALASVLSSRGRIDIDRRTNALIVTDVSDNLDLVAKIVTELDQETPQITISAKLYEIDSKALFEMGIDWTVLQDGRSGEQSTTSGISEVLGKFTYSTVKDDIDLDAVLSAMMSNNAAEILAHPEITTVDNKEATILMGQEIPLKTLDEAGNVITEMTQVGTQLTVTPHITSKNTILMDLKPERSSYEVDPGAGVIINTQQAQTSVVVRDGQTVVIGGLTTQDTKRSNKGLPLLKDIPLLGHLFKFSREEVVKTDLVIFVTPHIVTFEE